MTTDDLIDYLHTNIGIPMENLERGTWEGEARISVDITSKTPAYSGYVVSTYVDASSPGIIEVNPNYDTGVNPTKYAKLSGHFNRRLKMIWKGMEKLRDDSAAVRAQNDVSLKAYKAKHKDLIEKYPDNLKVYQVDGQEPVLDLLWFGSASRVDPVTNEVQLGYGYHTRTIPLSVALDFINECEVYKLLQE